MKRGLLLSALILMLAITWGGETFAQNKKEIVVNRDCYDKTCNYMKSIDKQGIF